jgi:hypothetical protein
VEWRRFSEKAPASIHSVYCRCGSLPSELCLCSLRRLDRACRRSIGDSLPIYRFSLCWRCNRRHSPHSLSTVRVLSSTFFATHTPQTASPLFFLFKNSLFGAPVERRDRQRTCDAGYGMAFGLCGCLWMVHSRLPTAVTISRTTISPLLPPIERGIPAREGLGKQVSLSLSLPI